MNTNVTLYGTAWCDVTRSLRRFMTQRRVPHRFHNVDNDPPDEAAAATMRDGRYWLPVVVVGDRTMRNPAEAVLERELRRRGVLAAVADGAAPLPATLDLTAEADEGEHGGV